MIPAMDRMPKLALLRPWVALVLVLGLGEAGCARLQSLRSGPPEPPLIGKVRESRDIYADAHRPAASKVEALAAGTTTSPSGSTLVGDLPPGSVEVQPTTGTAVSEVGRSESQPHPEAHESVDGVSTTSARATVPDSARRIALGPRNPTSAAEIARIVAEARLAVDGLNSYQLTMHRQERIGGALLPEEDVMLAVKRDPQAVRLTWPDGPHAGREVIYRSDEPGRLMHIKQNGPISRLNLPVDSPLVTRNSRHPVSEAGFDSLVKGLEDALKASDGTTLSLTYLVNSAKAIDTPILVRQTPAGETWRINIDLQTHLPSLVECKAANGDLLERYTFSDVLPNPSELLTADAFDPTARWGAARGLFSRLGGEGSSTKPTPAGSTPR